jgi:protein TonB
MQALKVSSLILAGALALCAQDSKLLRMRSVPESKILHKQPAAYPPDARDHRIQGVVRLNVLIGTNGKVEAVKLISGHPLLAPAAIQAVRHYVFEPFGTDEHPLRVSAEIDVPFALNAPRVRQ